MGAVSSLSADYLKGSGFLDNRVDACLLGCHLQHLIDALLAHIGTDVIGAALAKGILGNGRHAGIEVFIVGSQQLRALQMHQIAKQIAGHSGTVCEGDGIGLLGSQCVDLFHPNASQLTQRTGISAQMDIVRLVHKTAHEGSDQNAAVFHELGQRFLHALFDHIQYGSNHDLVLAEIGIHRDHIDADVVVIEELVIVVDLIHILQILGRTAGVIQCPVVIPVKDDTYICLVDTAQGRGAQPFQLLTELFDFPENAGVVVSYMTDNRTVELFTAANTAAQLEELHGIGTVGHGLNALRAHLAGLLQGVIGLPVLLAGGLLQQHKGCILQSTHQIVAHSRKAPGSIVAGIVVPGHDIHLLGPLEVVQELIGSHQIGGDDSIGVIPANHIPLHLVVFQHTVGHKSAVIHRKAGKCGIGSVFHAVTQGVGQYDLIPVIYGMTPEFHIPGLIDRFDGSVLILQPNPEGLLTVFTVAFATVLIADVPAGHMGVMCITLSQFFYQSLGVLLEYQRVGAMIVPLTELVMPAKVIRSGNLGILLIQPCRHSTGGSSQNDIVVFLAQHLHDLVQLIKIVGILSRLDLCPGKHIDGSAVDTGILKVHHILLPDLLGPLVGVVVSAV